MRSPLLWNVTLKTNRFGESGERIAEQWLISRGWKIVERRFRSGHRDIDLIAATEELDSSRRTIAFIEVKTRRSTTFGGPINAVNWKKQMQLCRSAQVWIARFRKPGDQYRFDVIGVLCRSGRVRVQHIENAFFVTNRS